MDNKEIKKDISELNDVELEGSTGGAGVQLMQIACSECGTINTINVSLSQYTCKKCGKVHYICG